MSDPLSKMMRMPAKRLPASEVPPPQPEVEDMAQSMAELQDKQDTSIIQIKGDIDLHESAQGIWVQIQDFFEAGSLFQLAVILGLSSLAYTISVMWQKKFRKLVDEAEKPIFSETGKLWIRRVNRVFFPAILAVFLLTCTQVAAWLSWPADLLRIAMNLAVAGTVIRFISTLIQSRVIAKWVAGVIWAIAALQILGWWGPTTSVLDSIQFGIGTNKISLLTVIKGLFYFVLFLWTATILSRVSEKHVKRIEEMTPSLRVLLTKLIRISLMVAAFLLGLNAIGVDLTSFAILGGAIGVGIGFGLQKVVSNFVSGIILLLDRSIKPGDVIAVEGSFGWVNTLGARYVSIIQRDGREHLIPNELLITEKVENWSFSNNDVRIPIKVGVSYNSDVRKAMELCLEAAVEEPRVKQFPKPVVRLTGFGDSAVDLEIRGWINDPVNGIGNIVSDVLLRVWDKFHENGIEIPYPQRDLHLRTLPADMMAHLKADVKNDLRQEMAAEAQAKN
jgi:small-conductance mechanosensitive channel